MIDGKADNPRIKMANYKIIGADLVEYGPASAEQIRQWMAEGRVDDQTKLQAEGTAEWKPLSEVPEFAPPMPGNEPDTCPKCGEKFEARFDSCWKCGTRKDGSPPKWTNDVEVEAGQAREELAGPCPKCGSLNIHQGRLMPSGQASWVIFRPEGTRFFSLSLYGGVVLRSDRSFACLDCGLVWSSVPRDELKEYIFKHCSAPNKDEAYRLLAEAARLESHGDMAGAWAKYEAVMEKFPGSGAAGDAEARLQNLKQR